MPTDPPQQSVSVADRFPTLPSFSQPIALATPPGETNRLFVAQKCGDLVVVPDLGAPTKAVFLDLDGLVNGRSGEVFQTSSEQGLLGFAFHPAHASNGWFHVVYSVNINGVRHQRLSRFTVSAGDANLADTASERILIEQKNDAGNHNGGDVHFGPDGYLYMSWGDEGNANDTLNNSQRIDKDFWSLDDSGGSPVIERLTGESGIVGFGYDPTDGEILMADINSGKVRKLVAQEITATFPQTLAETGLFSDAAALTPATGLIAYDVNLPFWSDHAVKRRWFGIPDPDAMVNLSREGNWTLPEGMLWVKHFDLETVRGDPASKKRLETRVPVRNAAGSYGVSYRWNEAETSASLAAPEGEEFDIEISENGNPVTQRWRIPSRASCITCHSAEAGHALSFRTRQLNRPGEISGTSGDFLSLLADEGYLENLDAEPANPPTRQPANPPTRQPANPPTCRATPRRGKRISPSRNAPAPTSL